MTRQFVNTEPCTVWTNRRRKHRKWYYVIQKIKNIVVSIQTHYQWRRIREYSAWLKWLSIYYFTCYKEIHSHLHYSTIDMRDYILMFIHDKYHKILLSKIDKVHLKNQVCLGYESTQTMKMVYDYRRVKCLFIDRFILQWIVCPMQHDYSQKWFIYSTITVIIFLIL